MRRGFTLIETIFASVLFGFILLFVLNIYPSSMVAVRRGEHQIVADNFAQSILEDLRSRSFANISPTSPPTYLPLHYYGVDFTPTVAVAYHPDAPPEQQNFLKVANVTVAWEFQRRDLQVVHTMYLHNVTR